MTCVRVGSTDETAGGARIGRCRAALLSDRDLAVGGQQLRSAARIGRTVRMAIQVGCEAFL
jgi:hypothetical protein